MRIPVCLCAPLSCQINAIKLTSNRSHTWFFLFIFHFFALCEHIWRWHNSCRLSSRPIESICVWIFKWTQVFCVCVFFLLLLKRMRACFWFWQPAGIRAIRFIWLRQNICFVCGIKYVYFEPKDQWNGILIENGRSPHYTDPTGIIHTKLNHQSDQIWCWRGFSYSTVIRAGPAVLRLS